MDELINFLEKELSFYKKQKRICCDSDLDYFEGAKQATSDALTKAKQLREQGATNGH